MVLQDEILTYTPEQLKEYAASMIFQLLSMLFSFVGIFIFLYIINGIALTAISKKLKFQSPYVAWIPLAAPYVEGKIGDYMRSNKLDKTHTRIHYLMFNFMYAVVWCSYQISTIFRSIDQCFEIYNTGSIPVELMSSSSDTPQLVLSALVSVLGIVVAFFRLRSLFMAHICFDKKKGLFLVLLTTVVPVIAPFLYLSLSRLTPVNTDIEKIQRNPL